MFYFSNIWYSTTHYNILSVKILTLTTKRFYFWCILCYYIRFDLIFLEKKFICSMLFRQNFNTVLFLRLTLLIILKTFFLSYFVCVWFLVCELDFCLFFDFSTFSKWIEIQTKDSNWVYLLSVLRIRSNMMHIL